MGTILIVLLDAGLVSQWVSIVSLNFEQSFNPNSPSFCQQEVREITEYMRYNC